MGVISGFINSRREPFVRIQLLSKGNQAYSHSAVIDTGFNGDLMIPDSLIVQCEWQWVGNEVYENASGDIVRENAFLGQIIWMGQPKRVYAMGSGVSDILIGTRLLKQNRLFIDFPARSVRIH